MRHIDISLAGLLATSLVASAASAQDTGEPRSAAARAEAPLEEIIVTAQKREQQLKDVPLAIQAITGETLEKQGIRSVGDAVLQVPSVSVQSSTPTQSVFQMRGMTQDPAVDSSVAVYVDEVPFGFPGDPFVPNIDALDLQRIEVLAGPGGTLYGLGAMGGTIRVITADPNSSEGFSGRGVIEGGWTKGGDPSYYGGFSLNVPIIQDVLAGRLVVSRRHIGGWIDNPVRGLTNINNDDVLNVRGKLLYTPTDKLKLKLTYWLNNIDAPWIAPYASHKNTDIQDATGSASDPEAFQNTFTRLLAGFGSYDLGFATVENSLSLYKESQPAEYVIGLAPGVTLDLPSLYHNKATTDEFRLVSNGNTAFQWVIGTFYRDATFSRFGYGNIGAFQIPPSTTTIKSKSISFFGEASYGFWDDRVRVLVGARQFHDDRDSLILVDNLVTDDIKKTFTNFDPRFNVAVKANKDLLFYFNAAKGFRSGFINSNTSTIGAALSGITGIQVVQPDTVWTYEVGSKATFLDGNLFMTTALFYSKWTGLQFGAITPLQIAFQINAGDTNVKGIEESITWRTPIKGLNVAASASYNHGKFTSVNPQIASFFPFVSGDDVPAVPAWTANLNLDYDAPLGNTGANLVAGANVRYQSRIVDGVGTMNPDGSFQATDPYCDVSLRAGVRVRMWEATVFVNNLTDSVKSVNLLANNWTAPIPRTIGLRLTADF